MCIIITARSWLIDSILISSAGACDRSSSFSKSVNDPVQPAEQDQQFVAALIGDGRSLLTLTSLALVFSGIFALFLSVTGSFLPHDVDFLGMQPRQLCALDQCRIVHFMFHDRVAFGGVLIAIGTLYLWLIHFPLGTREEWAWWVLVLSGGAGFASFLSYLGYGYLDTWHGLATLALLPCFLFGLWKTRHPLHWSPHWWKPRPDLMWHSRAGFGRICLLAIGLGKMAGGAVIMLVGMTSVFVPQDIHYLGLDSAALHTINPRLVPLIAHDRAGFGGGLFSCGLLVFLIVWKTPLTRSLWQALLIAGGTGFICAIGVHFSIGYLDLVHLIPAYLGAVLFLIGLVCSYPQPRSPTPGPSK